MIARFEVVSKLFFVYYRLIMERNVDLLNLDLFKVHPTNLQHSVHELIHQYKTIHLEKLINSVFSTCSALLC